MYDVKPPTIDWQIILPVTVVIVTGIVSLLIEMFRPKQNNNLIVITSLAGLLWAGAALLGQVGQPTMETFGAMVVRDSLATWLQLALVGVAFLSILFSEPYLRQKRISFGEFYPLVLWSTAGGMMMVSTNSLLMLFLGLEVLSIALYVLAGLSRKEAKSEESAIKYFLLGAFASGFLLYGISFIYGATGGVHLSGIEIAFGTGDSATKPLLIFGFALVLIGLSFKSAFVPFHQWTPDVYQGAPTNVTAFMAAGSKIAAVGALVRVLDASQVMKDVWLPALFWIAILTMTIANLGALVQKDVKRILGYSSISNAGYVLAAIVAHAQRPDLIGLGSTLFYLFSYGFMTIGAFAVISLVAKDGHEGTRLADLHGLWQRAPLAATSLVVFVISLIGIPITGGFFGKLFIFQDLQRAGLMPLAILLAVNSAISVYYYLGIAHAAVVAEEGSIKNESAPMTGGLTAACVICMVGVVAMGLFNSSIFAAFARIVN